MGWTKKKKKKKKKKSGVALERGVPPDAAYLGRALESERGGGGRWKCFHQVGNKVVLIL